MNKPNSRQTLLLLTPFAAILSMAGFVLEHGFNVLPCPMCWWQRYAHYTILAFAFVGLAAPRTTRPALAAILLTALAGLSIALWQFAAQHGLLPWPPSCTNSGQTIASAENLLAAMQTTKVIPCDKETFTLFGLSLAGYNIPAMLTVIALSAQALFRRP